MTKPEDVKPEPILVSAEMRGTFKEAGAALDAYPPLYCFTMSAPAWQIALVPDGRRARFVGTWYWAICGKEVFSSWDVTGETGADDEAKAKALAGIIDTVRNAIEKAGA